MVVGDREVKTGKLSVRVRGAQKPIDMGIDELIGRIEEEIKGYPRRPLTMPKYLSMRPASIIT